MRRQPAPLIVATLTLALILVGCAARLDPDDLGKVVFTIPKVPGAEKPYPMPEPYFPQGKPAASGPRQASPEAGPQQTP